MAWSNQDLVSFLELNPELRALLENKVENSTYQETVRTIDNHIINQDVHITPDERKKWNSTLDDSKAYVDKVIKDITAQLQDSAVGLSQDLRNHVNDTLVHVTTDDRKKWDSMGDVIDDHSDAKIDALRTELKAYIDNAIKTLITQLQNGTVSPSTVNGCYINMTDGTPMWSSGKMIIVRPSACKLSFNNGSGWDDVYAVYK